MSHITHKKLPSSVHLTKNKNARPVLYSYTESKNNLFQFLITEEMPPRNGDQEFFGIVQVFKYRTWAYFTQSQIDSVSQDFTLKFSDQNKPISHFFETQSGFHFSQKKAQSTKHYFNVAIIYLLSKNADLIPNSTFWLDKNIIRFRNYKKYPLINLALDDKQELFYGKKKSISFKNPNFSYPLFNCAFTKSLSQASSMNELVSILLGKELDGKNLNLIKKTISQNLLTYTYSPHYEINWFFLTMIQTIVKTFGEETLCSLIQSNNLSAILKHFKKLGSIEHDLLLQHNGYETFIKIVKELILIDREWALARFSSWDLPERNTFDFLPYFKELKKAGIEIQYTRYTSLKYLFNLISKEYSKLKCENVALPNKNQFDLQGEIPKTFQSYDLIVPRYYRTLIQWGAYLHNCAGNFEQKAYSVNSISIGLFKDGKIELLASIQNGYLTQLKGFKNSAPPKQLFIEFVNFLIENKIIYPNSIKEHCYTECCVQIG